MDLQENTGQTNRLRLFDGFGWDESAKSRRRRRRQPFEADSQAGGDGATAFELPRKNNKDTEGIKGLDGNRPAPVNEQKIPLQSVVQDQGVFPKEPPDLTPEPALFVAPNLMSWATIAPRSSLPTATLNVVFTSRGEIKPRRCRRLTRDVYDDIIRQCHEMEGRWRAQDGTVTPEVYQAMCERVAAIVWHVERYPF